MVTKELARRFCTAWNQATTGQVVTVYSDGSVNWCNYGRQAPSPWIAVVKDGRQLNSTAEAFDWLEALASESLARLNSLAK